MWQEININAKITAIVLFFANLLMLTGGACVSRVEHRWEDNNTHTKRPPLEEVSEVLSGDTIKLKQGRIIKYLGIQAPQKGEPFFETCCKANAWLLQPGKVILFFDEQTKDEQGRALAYVYTPSLGIFCFVNQELLEYGYAVITPSSNHKYKDAFLAKQDIAKAKKRGIWQHKSIISDPQP